MPGAQRALFLGGQEHELHGRRSIAWPLGQTLGEAKKNRERAPVVERPGARRPHRGTEGEAHGQGRERKQHEGGYRKRQRARQLEAAAAPPRADQGKRDRHEPGRRRDDTPAVPGHVVAELGGGVVVGGEDECGRSDAARERSGDVVLGKWDQSTHRRPHPLRLGKHRDRDCCEQEEREAVAAQRDGAGVAQHEHERPRHQELDAMRRSRESVEFHLRRELPQSRLDEGGDLEEALTPVRPGDEQGVQKLLGRQTQGSTGSILRQRRRAVRPHGASVRDVARALGVSLGTAHAAVRELAVIPKEVVHPGPL